MTKLGRVYTLSGMIHDRKQFELLALRSSGLAPYGTQFVPSWSTTAVLRHRLKHNWQVDQFPNCCVTGNCLRDSSR
jgi:hypothetical protein